MINNDTIKIEENIKGDENYYILKIPSLKDRYSFKRKTYDAKLLSNIIENKEYENIILNASKKNGETLVMKKKNNSFIYENFLMLISLIGLVLFVIFAYTFESHKKSKFLFIITAIIIISEIIITLYLCIFNFCRKDLPLDDMIEKNLNNYFEKINQQLNLQKNGKIKFVYDKENKSIKCLIKKNNKKEVNFSDKKINDII